MRVKFKSKKMIVILGRLSTFLLWTVIKLYVVFVLDCGWLAHTPSAWIPGTEDMKECYQDYVFYIKSIPRSLIAGLIVAAMVGLRNPALLFLLSERKYSLWY